MSDLEEGNPAHPEHDRYLLALGRATYAASTLAGIAFDILRVHGGVESSAMYSDPLGTLENRLRGMAKRTEEPWPELAAFLVNLASARELRNDLLHALPTKNGLHRRRANDLSFILDFDTVEQLSYTAIFFGDVRRQGTALLYRDNGRAVREWSGRAQKNAPTPPEGEIGA